MLGKLLLIYICNFHVLNHLLLIYICKLHWNLQASRAKKAYESILSSSNSSHDTANSAARDTASTHGLCPRPSHEDPDHQWSALPCESGSGSNSRDYSLLVLTASLQGLSLVAEYVEVEFTYVNQ
jgi:hypothetical protein